MNYREYIKNNVIKDHNKRILEVGPLNRPVICKNEYKNVYYTDIRSTDEIKALYTGNEYLKTTGINVDVSTIENIDYVLRDSYEETFLKTEKFDYVVASNVLEHVPDLIFTLKDIGTVLKSGGKLCVIYPDKRYCFDHFREAVSFRDAFDTFIRGPEQNARLVFDFYMSVVKENSPVKYWYPNEIESLIPQNEFKKANDLYQEALDGKIIDDVHYWPFTDIGFARFLYDCIRARLLPFHCVGIYPTQEKGIEFLTVLEYDESVLDNLEKELENLKNIMRELPLDYYNAMYAKIGNESLLWKNESKRLESEIKKRDEELSKYCIVVKEQQNALEEYRKQGEYVDTLEQEIKKYQLIVKQQQLALEEYGKQREYIDTLEKEMKKYQLIVEQQEAALNKYEK